jgi:NodT family efflux transporter outer membrane factor (OMF) lipoprotein
VHHGFKVGPEYDGPPAAEVACDWIDSNDARVIPCPPPCEDWWSVFQDPVLNCLIETAYEQNLTLQEAGWRVMQARARRAIAAGNLFPQTQEGFGGYEHIQESQSVALAPPLRAFDQWSTGVHLAWELDVWGRFRRGIAAADADLEASVGDYDAILISLIAEVATAYTDYRTFEQRLQFARQNVKIQEGSFKLTQEKADAGSTGETGVRLSESSLESTRAAIPSLETGLRQSANRLCTLLGVPPQDLTEMLGRAEIPSAPPEVAVGIPADLIRRRPDVRAAERAVAAQSEQIGIALSDLYPHFSISGEFALESEEFADLFHAASTAGSIGPSFRWDLLNYGRIINNVRLQESGLEELIARYRNSVLTANREVEDALVAFLNSQQRAKHLEATEEATEEALRLLTLLFNEGEIDFTGVFVLQGDLVAKQDQLAQARGDVALSLIDLYKALGGGWEIRCRGVEPGGAPLPGVPVQPWEPLEAVPAPNPDPSLPAPAGDAVGVSTSDGLGRFFTDAEE